MLVGETEIQIRFLSVIVRVSVYIFIYESPISK